ncbi:uncharacterized protein LOC123308514 [Coccinella septempunctata]|uniref:uncharacterized protein LOC123308514 n=1 Tax=Coccinella septempunctata TaxID=41139 RepID=UPI001D075F78|nr:uncharacterized protein LOC123308514 [Coccinella septempunctata]
MNEYENLGHMTKINTSNDSIRNTIFYLPHHGVMKTSSTTTKLRVVFDGSSKTSSGISLNDVLKVGPTIQNDLFTIVIRFRTYKYVVTADIEKMYRMVKIRPDQRDLQRILWRSDQSQELCHYKLNTVTYGTASAAFLAIRALFQVAKENETKFPKASQVIKSSFYVDDLLTGFDSIEDGKKVLSELVHILSSAGFNLRKFVSNNSEMLEHITQVKSESTQTFINNDETTKTLGLIWNSADDIFKYTVSYNQSSNVTKRTILSVVAQIFDPLGLIGPCTIKAKIIIQKLWQLGFHWDESLPVNLHSAWIEFSSQILYLHSINVARHIICSDPISIELHCFGDASEKAYGTCCYLRSVDQFNQIHVHLVCAKSRVAPLKMITLPKLELCAALLSIQLSQKVLQAMSDKIDNTYYWSDSSIALAWINTESHQLKTFVANRVTEIQQFSNKNQWGHVPSESNPADIISRGINPKELMECKLWWNGPVWLSREKSFWPKTDILPQSEIPEIKKTDLTLIIMTDSQDISIIDRFSSLTKLHRVIAFCQRFINNSKISIPENRFAGKLSKSEIDNSLNTICKLVQRNAFPSEFVSLEKYKQISPNSKIVSLNPFMDKNGLIRVGGRLKHSNLTYNQKHPILLPHHCNYTKLVIRHEHLRHLHAGAQATLAAVRSKFWLINGRSAVRGVLRRCVTCFRSKPIESRYQMGDIPNSRLKPQRPFATTGIDFAGPFHIKDGRTKNRKIIKCYLCIFVCFVTKAAHLELSEDLSSESFLKCLTRFVSRRGVCTDIYSDNGTNFVGTERELKIVLSNLENNSQFNDFLNLNRINWHFSPPHAPNFGGLWEACVKSTKFHLKRIVGNSHLTFEGLYTVITQVEAVLNSRPLSPMSNDPNDLSPLTPGHFLIGEPLTTLPQDDVRHVASNRLSHFKNIQKQMQHFWQRWSHEHLNHLQERMKWRQSTPNLETGILVLLKDDNTAPLCWKMGRIIDVFPGKDGIVRVVNVKTANGVFKRPVSKICVLPINS